MKKISGLALVSLMLVGCAASQPPAMPVDSNPSDALKFARAMDLRQITDAGDQYLIYNGFYPMARLFLLNHRLKLVKMEWLTVAVMGWQMLQLASLHTHHSFRFCLS